MKIFVIGFNKTGTVSLWYLFRRINNLKVSHVDTPVMEIIDKYDAFTDGDHQQFTDYYNKYPDSLFILNTRPIQKWLISRYTHGSRDCRESWCWPISEELTNLWIKERENHYNNVLNFFMDKPKQLLIVNIEKPKWGNVVLQFINKPSQELINIHFYPSPKIDENLLKRITQHVTKCLTEQEYTGNELLNKDTNISLYPYTTHL